MDDLNLSKDDLFELFYSYDDDKNGKIGREELGRLCADLGLELGTVRDVSSIHAHS